MSQTTITDIGTVGIPVSDQDKALEFFTGTLGFEKRLDLRAGEGLRWVTVAAPDAAVSVALICTAAAGKTGTAGKTGGAAVGQDTGIRFMVPDAEAEHTAMREH